MTESSALALQLKDNHATGSGRQKLIVSLLWCRGRHQRYSRSPSTQIRASIFSVTPGIRKFRATAMPGSKKPAGV
jgi:hypothetical protein